MKFKRTPDERFEKLVDYAFQPHYLEVDDTEGGKLRIHYLDEGAADGDVVLLLHGQPAWSYLYRHMIGPLVEAGFRVVVPDLVGFGRSDKPTEVEDYTYARHVAWMSDWLTQLDLDGITVFLQDWGSLIGLRLVAAFPERFAGVVLANGGLPAGPVLNTQEVMDSEHTKVRDMRWSKDWYTCTGTPIKFSRTPGSLKNVPPNFAADTDAILSEHGFGDDEVA